MGRVYPNAEAGGRLKEEKEEKRMRGGQPCSCSFFHVGDDDDGQGSHGTVLEDLEDLDSSSLHTKNFEQKILT
jgi:hypothetical protein